MIQRVSDIDVKMHTQYTQDVSDSLQKRIHFYKYICSFNCSPFIQLCKKYTLVPEKA